MQYLVAAIPLAVIAVVIVLILRSALRGRVAWTPRTRRPRPPKSTLRVTRSQIDKDLDDLIRRR